MLFQAATKKKKKKGKTAHNHKCHPVTEVSKLSEPRKPIPVSTPLAGQAWGVSTFSSTALQLGGAWESEPGSHTDGPARGENPGTEGHTFDDAVPRKRAEEADPQRQSAGERLPGAGRVTANKDAVPFPGDERVLKLAGGNGCTTTNIGT